MLTYDFDSKTHEQKKFIFIIYDAINFVLMK